MNTSSLATVSNSSATDLTRRFHEFNSLQSALRSGNIASAQSAFAGFLQEVQKTSQAAGGKSLFAPGTQPANDLKTLGSALNAADIAGAQRAFAALQEDIQHAGIGTCATPMAPSQSRGPLTHSQIAHNGARAFAASGSGQAVKQAVGKVLSLQA